MGDNKSLVQKELSDLTFGTTYKLSDLAKVSNDMDLTNDLSKGIFEKMKYQGILPKGIDKPEDINVSIYYGVGMLGLHPFHAVKFVRAINNSVCVETEVLSALVRSRFPGSWINPTQISPSKCVVKAHREGEPDAEFPFTYDEGVNGAQTKVVWEKHKQSMTLTKAIRLAVKTKWPELFCGIEVIPSGVSTKEQEDYIKGEYVTEDMSSPSIPEVQTPQSKPTPVPMDLTDKVIDAECEDVKECDPVKKYPPRDEMIDCIRGIVKEWLADNQIFGDAAKDAGNSFFAHILRSADSGIDVNKKGWMASVSEKQMQTAYDYVNSKDGKTLMMGTQPSFLGIK